jgi:hypothetical protein
VVVRASSLLDRESLVFPSCYLVAAVLRTIKEKIILSCLAKAYLDKKNNYPSIVSTAAPVNYSLMVKLF